MLFIEKGPGPAKLTEYRTNKWNSEEQQPVFPSYENMPTAVKDAIRASLLQEQGYLCAYCMRRITAENVKIEHWQAERELDEPGRLDYSNMLGVCTGKAPANQTADHNIQALTGKEAETCDQHRGHTPLYADPRDKRHIGLIKYKSNGIIYSEDEKINADLNDTLNLNCGAPHFLPKNRKEVLDTVINLLSKKHKDKQWKKYDINKLKNDWETRNVNGELNAYAGIVLWYINSRLNSKRT